MHERQSVKRLIILNLCERLRTVADAKSCRLKAETGVRFPLGAPYLTQASDIAHSIMAEEPTLLCTRPVRTAAVCARRPPLCGGIRLICMTR
jgi:hypothetical protein